MNIHVLNGLVPQEVIDLLWAKKDYNGKPCTHTRNGLLTALEVLAHLDTSNVHIALLEITSHSFSCKAPIFESHSPREIGIVFAGRLGEETRKNHYRNDKQFGVHEALAYIKSLETPKKAHIEEIF